MPRGVYTRSPAIERLLKNVIVNSITGCWEWQGRRKTKEGYGRIYDGKDIFTHRYSYEYFREEIPEGLKLDHLCRNPPCVNPDHLEPVTTKENILRGIGLAAVNANKTHCVNGHPFDDVNTYQRPTGGRGCKICRYNNLIRFRNISLAKKER